MAKRKYKKISCHRTKTAAKKEQKKQHGKNNTATVRKNGKEWCVFSAGKKKTTKKRGRKHKAA